MELLRNVRMLLFFILHGVVLEGTGERAEKAFLQHAAKL